MARDANIEPTCCGMSEKQQEKVVEVIKSIAINGLSLVKHLSELLSFLADMGIHAIG
jgi:hypothetical protein